MKPQAPTAAPAEEGQAALWPAGQRQGAWRANQGCDQGQSRDASPALEVDLDDLPGAGRL